MITADDNLIIWTVYAPPAAGRIHLAREFVIDRRGQLITRSEIAGALDNVRGFLAQHGLYRIGRTPADAPDIVESWL